MKKKHVCLKRWTKKDIPLFGNLKSFKGKKGKGSKGKKRL
jgi:hypothetical protein